MIYAYYDESGEYGGGNGGLLNMSMGCCVATNSNWQKFDIQWQGILAQFGLEWFHMTEFEAWRGPFDFRLSNGQRDQDRHNALLKSLLETILGYSTHFAGFAESMPIPAERSRQHASAMEGCVYAAVKHAVHDLWEQFESPITLIFGEQSHFGASRIRKYIELFNFGDGAGRVFDFAMEETKKSFPLQAADVIAYEISREQRGRDRRYPMQVLIDGAKERGIPFTLNWYLADRLSDGRRERRV